MTTRREAAAFIRFQLEQLRSKNAFHEFEHICRQYSRIRLDPSVVPATGPVSAGGDQGRDFESLLKFEGVAEHGVRSVFACTLQEEDLSSKLQRDLRAISSGGAVRAVFFCCTDVPVGIRHKWQEWASTNLHLQLDVIDGQALSEHLADDDLVWIAEEYLGISRVHLPAGARSGSCYDKLASVWMDPKREITCIDDFLSVRYGIRHTTRPIAEDAADAVIWLRAMRRFIDCIPTSSHPLWSNAVYEYVTGSFYLTGQLEGIVPFAEKYLNAVLSDATECGPDQLRDALTVLNCLAGCSARADTGISQSALWDWREAISSRCASSLELEERPSRRCGFFSVQALLSLFDSRADERTRQDGALNALREITKIVDEARFYGVHALAEALTTVAPVFSARNEFNEITAALDSAVAKRFGGAAAARLCSARAMRFCDAKLVCNAVRELHRAKTEWFSRESLSECISAFEVIAGLYMDLGLHLAALYYAEAGLALVGESNDVELVARVPAFIHTIADCRYLLGQSFDYVQAADVALRLSGDRDSIERTLVRYLGILALIDRLEPRLSNAIRTSWKEHPRRDSFEANASMAAGTIDDILRNGETMTNGLFTDCGRQRRVEWHAYEAQWVITCPNRRQDVEAAEAIGAMLQIVHADMFDREPWFSVGLVQMTVTVQGTGNTIDVREDTDGIALVVGPDWWMASPPELIGGFAALIAAVFLKRDMTSVLERSLEDGLSTKLLAGAPYPILRSSALLGQRPRLLRSRRLAEAQIRPSIETHKELQPDSPRIDGHAGAAWDRAITGRYERWITKLGPSLRALRRLPEVMDAVLAWRLRGVPEWHIVGALGSVLVSIEFSRTHGEDAMHDGSAVLSFFESLVDTSVDLADATIERADLERSLQAYLGAFLVSEGVRVDPRCWDRNRYEVFAELRLGFGEPGPSPPDWLGEHEASVGLS